MRQAKQNLFLEGQKNMRILVDTREPWPHPWAKHLPEVEFVREMLDTGDIALAGNPMIVIERKTVPDFMQSITSERDRFERELERATKLDQFTIIVEGCLSDCIGGGMSINSVVGTVAKFFRFRWPILFADTESLAAKIAIATLSQPIDRANKLVGRVQRAAKKPLPALAPIGENGKPLY